MSKIKAITVSNLKSVATLSADFNGCTAIITGGNNKGKTSFLRGLFDRVRGIKPDKVLKEGETEGFAECELTTGEKLKWEFNDKGKGFKEKLTYITEKEVRLPLTVELRNKFLPDVFDVDEFLADPPMKQKKTLQKLVGIDFSDLDTRYQTAYNMRETKNRRAKEEEILFTNIIPPQKVITVDVSDLSSQKEAIKKKLNDLYFKNKNDNDAARKLWLAQCDEIRENVQAFNKVQTDKRLQYNSGNDALSQLKIIGYTGKEVLTFIDKIVAGIENHKEYKAPAEPEYIVELPDDIELKAIDEQIEAANETNKKANEYTSYLNQKERTAKFATEAEQADVFVKQVEKERLDLILSAKMPDSFGFSDDGITFNGLAFTREQQSSSGLYIAALKLAAMKLGEVKTLHFDASFLDKNSLADIEKWAVSEDLQLLIERPDFEGGEIEYQLLCK